MIKAESWTYVSGRVAALEGALLSAETVDRLAAADSASAAAAALADSPLRATVASENAIPARVAGAIAAHYAGMLLSLEGVCPAPELFALAVLPVRYHSLKERVRSALKSEGAAHGSLSPDAVVALLGEDFAADAQAAAALSLIARAETGPDAPSPGLVLDLCLDSAQLLDSMELAGRLGDPGVAAHARDAAAVKAVLAVWRARLLCADGGAPDLERALPRFFLRGELGSGLAGQLWDLPLGSWGDVLGARLDARLGGDAFGYGEAGRVAGWEKAAFDWLGRRACELRGQAFGAGRVWAYTWALAVEERNVRLALIGRLRGVGAAAVRGLLWGSCGG